ncbi:hypothetical protein PSACC_01837 [Paramicrosporidium saccamoebae]|uniref:Uncharacterized protein n=1 Tax=Paramicrosporidium saccamoebae TaxID=1246581 RepID=A0A2H9TKS4_9FUNG|nr:hypothetical protein PSACC_01837 [Paramicrosporidium saccamoebae]
MKVPTASIIALAACLLSTVSAVIDSETHYVLQISGSGNYEVVPKQPSAADCKTPAANLNANPSFICLDQKHFLKGEHFKDVKLSDAVLSLLFQYASGNDSDANSQVNKDLLAKVAGNIGKDVDVTYGQALGQWYPYLPASFFSSRKGDVSALLKAAQNKGQLKAMLNKLDASLVKESKEEIFTQMKARQLEMKSLDDKIQVALLNEAEGCVALEAEQLSGFDSNSFTKLTHGCLSAISDISTYSHWNVGIRSIPSTVFNNDIELHADAYKYMTVKQISALGKTDPDKNESCKHVPLGHYLQGNGAEMTPKCFAAALKGYIPGTDPLGKTFNFLPANILSEVTENDLVLKLDAEWPYISVEQKKHLFEGKKCADVSAKALHFHNHFAISQECFEELPSESKPLAVIHADLPDTALADVDASEVAKWEVGDHKGLMVLEVASERPNIGKLLEHASTKVNGEHICALVEDADELKALPVIQEYGTKACFEAMQYKVTLNDLKKFAPNVEKVISVEALIKDLDPETGYKDLSPKTLGRLAKVSTICSAMTLPIFNGLSDETHRKFPAECMSQLNFLGDIPKDTMTKINKEAFANLTADMVAKIPADHLTEEQFGMAGSGVSDSKKHPASLWTNATMAKFTSSNVRYVHASAWKAAPADAYSGLSEHAFGSIEPKDMEEMTHEQISQVSEAARLKLTVEQAKHLGLKVTDGTHPLTSIASLKGLSESVSKAVQTRMAATPAAPADAPPSEEKK